MYGHDLTHELNALGFNLDRRAVALGVSESWADAAQDRVAWRDLVMRRRKSTPISKQAPPRVQSKQVPAVQAAPGPETPNSALPSAAVGGGSTGSRAQAPQGTPWAHRLRARG